MNHILWIGFQNPVFPLITTDCFVCLVTFQYINPVIRLWARDSAPLKASVFVV